MDVHQHSIQTERLEVVETGPAAALVRRREASGRVEEFGDAAWDIIDSEAPWHSRSLLMTWRRAFRPKPMGPDILQTRFVRAMVPTTETMAAEPGRAAEW